MEAQDRLFELVLSKMDDLKEQCVATHGAVTALDAKVDQHIEDDRILSNEVWFVKRAFQATWGAVIGVGGLWLAWLGVRNS